MSGAIGGMGLIGLPTLAKPTTMKLERGINVWPWFSLTREYPAPRTDYAWPPFQLQRPIPRFVDLQRLKKAGLDFIRLPVDPGPFLSATDEARIGLFKMLSDAIASAIDAGLSVLVNLQANSATHFWTPDRMIASQHAPAFSAFVKLVENVAGLLRRFDSARVAFEPVNEPPQICSSSEWSQVQMVLLKAARAVAPDLSLVATGACGSMISGLLALDPLSLLKLEPILFTFHFYEPYLFTHQGAPWMRESVYRSLNQVPWPASKGSLAKTLAAVNSAMAKDNATSAKDKELAMQETERALIQYFEAQPDVKFIQRYFAMVHGWANANAIPAHQILLGEFGALRSDARYVASKAPDRARYIRDVRETAESFGLPWAFWNLFDGFGLMDDTTREFDQSMVSALGLINEPR